MSKFHNWYELVNSDEFKRFLSSFWKVFVADEIVRVEVKFFLGSQVIVSGFILVLF